MGKIYIGSSSNPQAIEKVEVVKEEAVQASEISVIYRDVPVEVIKEVEKIVEVIKEVEVVKEVIKEVIVDRPVEVIKHIETTVEIPVEVIKEVEVIKQVVKIEYMDRIRPVPVMPSYVPVLMAMLLLESASLIYLVLKTM